VIFLRRLAIEIVRWSIVTRLCRLKLSFLTLRGFWLSMNAGDMAVHLGIKFRYPSFLETIVQAFDSYAGVVSP